jgi:Spy/CpxP family protein refolding chaperone
MFGFDSSLPPARCKVTSLGAKYRQFLPSPFHANLLELIFSLIVPSWVNGSLGLSFDSKMDQRIHGFITKKSFFCHRRNEEMLHPSARSLCRQAKALSFRQIAPFQKRLYFFVTVLVPKTTWMVKPVFFGNTKSKEDRIMRRKIMFMGTAAVLMILAVAFGAQAGPFGPGHRGHGLSGTFDGLKAFLELKLTDAQQTALMNVMNKYQDQMENLRGEMKEAGSGVRALLEAPVFDEQEARKAFRAASAVREDLFVLRAKMLAEMKGLLTPEQLELFKERRAERFERLRQGLTALSEVPGE